MKAEQELTKSEEIKEIKEGEDVSNDAKDALQILGYNRKEIDKVLQKIDRNLSTEEIIKNALKLLS